MNQTEQKDRIVILGLGGPAILFVILGLGSVYALIMTVIDAAQKVALLEFAIAVMLYGWFIIFSYKFVMGNKIVLDSNSLFLTFNEIIRHRSYNRIFPHTVHFAINDINNIKVVAVATENYLNKHIEILGKTVDTFDAIGSIRGISVGVIARQLGPVIYVQLKDSTSELIQISTKPFSKRGCQKLIKALKSRGVNIFIQPEYGLIPGKSKQIL